MRVLLLPLRACAGYSGNAFLSMENAETLPRVFLADRVVLVAPAQGRRLSRGHFIGKCLARKRS